MNFNLFESRPFAWVAILAYCLLALLHPTMLQAASGDEFFIHGVRAFNGGNFSAAADFFQRARAAGVNTPALFYNLGASLYKLGKYADAERAFRLCANDPTWASLAHYNIGLTAYRRGDHKLAAANFERAWRIGDNREVRALALTMLDRLNPAIGTRIRGTVDVSIGHNDNVTLATNDRVLDTTEEADWFVDLFAFATGQWGTRSDAPYWNVSFYNINYVDLSDNNTSELALGTGKSATFGTWDIDVNAGYQYVSLHGHALEHNASVRVEGARAITGGPELHISAKLSAIDTFDEDFDYLDGSRGEIEVWLSHQVGDGSIDWGTAFENDDRRDIDTGAEFLSYSAKRYGLWAWGSWPAGDRWRIESTLKYSLSRYADPERRGGIEMDKREDGEFEVGARLRYRLSPVWSMAGEYSLTDNNSNFSEFAYRQRVLWLGVAHSL